MVRRWMNVVLVVVVVVAVAGLVGCHKKKEAAPANARTGPGNPLPPSAAGTPEPTGPVTYPEGEGPLVISGAQVRTETKGVGQWYVEYTADWAPQQVAEYYRAEANKRGWHETASKPVGAGQSITWKTPHGEAHLTATKRAGGGTNVYMTWNSAS